MIIIVPNAVPRQLLTKPIFLFLFFKGLGCRGDINVPVNLLTSCMLRELWGWLGYIILYIYINIYIYVYIYNYIHI